MLKTSYKFKVEYPYDVRKAESMRIRHKYPTKIPIILEDNETGRYNKYLICDNMSVGKLLYTIRMNTGIKSSEAIFMYINNNFIPSSNELLKKIYETNMDEDGYLYIRYARENTFG